MLSQTVHHTQVGGVTIFLKLACYLCQEAVYLSQLAGLLVSEQHPLAANCDDCLEDEARLSELFCALLCTKIVLNYICTLIIWAVVTGDLGPVGLSPVSIQTQSLALCKRKPQETQALALASSQSWLPLLRPSISYWLALTQAPANRNGYIFCVLFFLLGCQYHRNRLPGKTRLRIDLLCVKCNVKHYSLIHSLRYLDKKQLAWILGSYILISILGFFSYLLCEVALI